MKRIIKAIAWICGVVGIIVLTFGTVISVGYGLYLWGGLGIVFGVAVWTGFKLWIGCLITGIVLVLIRVLGDVYVK